MLCTGRENDQNLVPAQLAVLAIVERLFDEDKPQDEQHKLCLRMLIDRSQTGPLLGKGGSIITKMRQDSGAIIKIRQNHEVPPCAGPNDDLLEVGRTAEAAWLCQIVMAVRDCICWSTHVKRMDNIDLIRCKMDN